MARNGNKGAKSDFGDANAISGTARRGLDIVKWLSPYLNAEDTTWLQDNRDDIPQFVFGVLAELPTQYTLSSKFDDRTDRWLATLKCIGGDDPNSGIAVTGRGSTRINSVYTCLYIAAVKLQWSWAEHTTSNLGDFG